MSTAIVAEIVLYAEAEGGRKAPVIDAPEYRPHLVVGDRNQREPLVDGHSVAGDSLLGVAFSGDGEVLAAGVAHTVRLTLLYPRVDYRDLVEGATFTVREGPVIVGHGVVLDRD